MADNIQKTKSGTWWWGATRREPRASDPTRRSSLEDLGADSLDTVELVMAFEEEFGIDVPTKKQRSFRALATSFATSKRTPDEAPPPSNPFPKASRFACWPFVV